MLVSAVKDSLRDNNLLDFVKQEQTKYVLKIQSMAHAIQVLLILTCAFTFYGIVDTNTLLIWSTLHFTFILVRALASYYFSTLKKQTVFSQPYAAISLSFYFLSAVLWGLTVFYIDLRHYPEESFLLMIIAMGICVGSIGVGGYWRAFFIIYTPTISIFYVIGLLFDKTQSSSTLATAFALLSLYISRLMYVAYYDNIENLLLRRKHELLASSRFSFLATASHDLRQPLQALNLFLSALKHEGKSDPQLINQIEESIQALNSLLNRILDLSKLDSESLEIHIEPVSLSVIFSRLSNYLKTKADKKQLDLIIPETDLWVNTDAILVERIFSNLLENAINYTDTGSVELSIEKLAGNQLVVSIKDSGIGMSQKEQLNIFEEFYQVSNVERDTEKGLGLGLSIVRRVCNLLSIPLSLDSTLGKGSTFSLTFDVCENQLAEPDERVSINNVSFELTNKCALIIDDNKLVRQSIETQLRSWGMKVFSGDSSETIISLLKAKNITDSNDIDIIISDYHLIANQTGIDAIRSIKDYLVFDEIPTLIITGETLPEKIDKIRAKNFSLLHKPIKPSKLRSAIQRKLMSNS